jgi:hypothetical protein
MPAPFLSPQPPTPRPYGEMPCRAPSRPDRTRRALTRGQGGFTVVTYSLTWSPASVVANTTAEQVMTPVGGTGASVTNLTTSLYVVNKPTAQAGLGSATSAALPPARSPSPSTTSPPRRSRRRRRRPGAWSRCAASAPSPRALTPLSVAANTTAGAVLRGHRPALRRDRGREQADRAGRSRHRRRPRRVGWHARHQLRQRHGDADHPDGGRELHRLLVGRPRRARQHTWPRRSPRRSPAWRPSPSPSARRR